MKRACPRMAIGGGARIDHLFEDGKSLCGNWMYGSGREVDPEDLEYEEGEICKECAREAGLIE